MSAIYPPPPKKRSTGLIVGVVALFALALLGIIETVILITLAVTGQIG